jgi:ribonucleoside-diphosphate reductase alpha chain
MLRNKIVAVNGSVVAIPEIPTELKTVWEISQPTLDDMAATNGAYIDQSHSFNVFTSDVNFGKLTSMHFTPSEKD